MRAAATAGLHLSNRQVADVTAALAAPERAERLALLLPFVRSCSPSAVPLLREWASGRGGEVLGKWAAVMLAEQGRWEPQTVQTLFSLLPGTDDVLRNRAWMRLVWLRESAQLIAASRLRLPSLLAIGRVRNDQGLHGPQVTLVAVWAFESISFDDPSVVARCARLVEEGGPEAAAAGGVLEGMREFTPRVATEILTTLDDSAHPAVHRSLLRALAGAWHGRLGKLRGNHPLVAKARDAIVNRLESADPAVRATAHLALARFADAAVLKQCAGRLRQADPRSTDLLRLLAVSASLSPAVPQMLREDADLLQFTRPG